MFIPRVQIVQYVKVYCIFNNSEEEIWYQKHKTISSCIYRHSDELQRQESNQRLFCAIVTTKQEQQTNSTTTTTTLMM